MSAIWPKSNWQRWDEMFANREEAGKKLAEKLKDPKGDLLVMAIPRGGVVVGKEISLFLNCPLQVLIVKKIGSPYDPELAIGTVGPKGEIRWNLGVLGDLGIDLKKLPLAVKKEIKNAKIKMKKYKLKFKNLDDETDLTDKTLILTDDGIATGVTIETAWRYIRARNPKKIILAVPVAPKEVIDKFKNMFDEAIILKTPENFSSVGEFYKEFPQVSDEDVIKLLRR